MKFSYSFFKESEVTLNADCSECRAFFRRSNNVHDIFVNNVFAGIASFCANARVGAY